MNTGDEEQVFISALRAGDVVRHPETLEWMVIVDLEEGVFTRKEFNRGEDVACQGDGTT
jgi:hypothetical protein